MFFCENIVWFSACILVSLFGYVLFKWIYRPKNSPPGPRGFPLVGMAPYFKKNYGEVVGDYVGLYGDVMSFRMGMNDFIMLNSLESISEVSSSELIY